MVKLIPSPITFKNIENASRIESFDNSHLFGTYYVAGMVVFENFLPLKNEYRKYVNIYIIENFFYFSQ